ncbi:MAG: helix-turn-helix transcriptional regulator [Deltaproteobacteria bacterium]|nr:helix-turn-helix transcriptional regulator [Deltaproteobacteria bacterium]
MKDPEFKKAYEQESLRFEIAERVRQEREARKLSQDALAEQAHTTQRVISRIERGQVSVGVDVLQRIAGALNLRITISAQ